MLAASNTVVGVDFGAQRHTQPARHDPPLGGHVVESPRRCKATADRSTIESEARMRWP